MNSFFRLVGHTLSPPTLTSITPRPMLCNSDIETTSETLTQPPSPPIFTPTETLLYNLGVSNMAPHPYKLHGPNLPVSIWQPEGSSSVVRVRVDMPGVNRVEFKVDRKDYSLCFTGFEEEITMHGIGKKAGIDVCRVYVGFVELDAMRFPVVEYDHELSNGVLSFEFRSKRPAICGDLGVKVKAFKNAAEPEILRESAINPLVQKGLDRYCHHGFKDGEFFFAIDMPGIGETDSMTFAPVGTVVNFFAEDKSPGLVVYGESDIEDRREYEGYVSANMDEFDTDKGQFEVIHGVFWIRLPKKVKPPTEMVTLLLPDDQKEITFEFLGADDELILRFIWLFYSV